MLSLRNKSELTSNLLTVSLLLEIILIYLENRCTESYLPSLVPEPCFCTFKILKGLRKTDLSLWCFKSVPSPLQVHNGHYAGNFSNQSGLKTTPTPGYSTAFKKIISSTRVDRKCKRNWTAVNSSPVTKE